MWRLSSTDGASTGTVNWRPGFLWTICPLLLYWLGRMTLLANRGAVADDPVVFAARDRVSWLTGLCVLTVFAAAV